MSLLIILMIAMFAVVWFGADKSPRRQVLFPSFTGGGMGNGKPNPYMLHMCQIGGILGVIFGLIGGLIVWLASVMP